MKVIVLPGYSLGNREFLQNMRAGLQNDFEVMAVEWQHWSDNKTKIEDEMDRVRETIGNEEVYVVAKSIGTWVAAQLLALKYVFCGIPVNDLSKSEKQVYKAIDHENLLVIQNEFDPHGSWDQVRKFLKRDNVIKQDRNDHTYPYVEEIGRFLK